MINPKTVVYIGILALVVGANSVAQAQTVFFDDTDPALLRLGNAGHYEIGFQKSNGAIAYILNPATGEPISAGSNGAQLWTTFLPDNTPSFIGAAGYRSASGAFQYAWDAQTQTLNLNYVPEAAAPQLTAHVEVTASEYAYFDMVISVENNEGQGVTGVGFPSDLLFPSQEIKEALLPIIPGVVLESGFFREGRTFTRRYPGWPGLFVDFQQVQTQQGGLALYTLNSPSQSAPMITIGFAGESWVEAGHAAMLHVFETYIDTGETWESPVVRVRVGETREATIEALRRDNELDGLSSVQEKLGPLFERISQAPLLKAELPFLFRTHGLDESKGFRAFLDLLPRLPSPALFHPLGFHVGGFDHNYPDFLNLSPSLGTMDDLVALLDRAHELGLLVMPYTNPTWWDESSLTVQSELGALQPEDIAVQRRDGSPLVEVYNNNDGLVVSPHHPFVETRIDRLLDDLAGATFDLIFEDQVGARAGMHDFNPSAPSPNAYLDGWLEHARTHAGKHLATEMGFDRLAETMWGFFGSVLLFERRGDTDAWWGRGNWHVFPLTMMIIGDKALFYQHDLAEESATQSLENLTWNLAMGFILGFDLQTGERNAPEMLDVIGAFQHHVANRYAGERMVAYDEILQNVTRSTFESVEVVANARQTAYTEGGHTLVPEGVLVTSLDGHLTAGVFSAFNSQALTAGEHYIIVDQSDSMADSGEVIRVWQPLGGDTPLDIPRPASWDVDDQIRVLAVGRSDTVTVERTVNAETIRFEWSRVVGGMKADHYLLRLDDTATNTAMERADLTLPSRYSLSLNYPNPFNLSTTIEYALPAAGNVKLIVYDVLGREVIRLLDQPMDAGYHQIEFNAGVLPSGVYVYRLVAGNFVQTRRMVLLK